MSAIIPHGFQAHLIPYLTIQDIGHAASTDKENNRIFDSKTTWQIIFHTDPKRSQQLKNLINGIPNSINLVKYMDLKRFVQYPDMGLHMITLEVPVTYVVDGETESATISVQLSQKSVSIQNAPKSIVSLNCTVGIDPNNPSITDYYNTIMEGLISGTIRFEGKPEISLLPPQ